MESMNQENNISTDDIIRTMIDREIDFKTISEFTDLSMSELLEIYKNNYPEQYNKEIYEVMREENINVFSDASQYLEDLAKLSDEKHGRGK